MNKLSALGIARIVRAVADPLNHPRLDAAAPELVASLEAGLTCYAALDLIHAGDRLAQIRFSPRRSKLGLSAGASFQFIDAPAAAALEISAAAVRVARAAAMAQAVIDIDAAGGTVPVDADFAQLLEISPEGAAASLRNLAAAFAAGHPATLASIEPAAGPPRRRPVKGQYDPEVDDPSLVPIWADVLAKVAEISTMAHKIGAGVDARRLADRTANATIRAFWHDDDLLAAPVARGINNHMIRKAGAGDRACCRCDDLIQIDEYIHTVTVRRMGGVHQQATHLRHLSAAEMASCAGAGGFDLYADPPLPPGRWHLTFSPRIGPSEWPRDVRLVEPMGSDDPGAGIWLCSPPDVAVPIQWEVGDRIQIDVADGRIVWWGQARPRPFLPRLRAFLGRLVAR